LDVHLIDGTYELFRHYYALPSARDSDGREVAAVRGVLASVLGMMKAGATHIGVATDHVIESFRNGLWPGYKTSEGIEPDLLAQSPLLEEVLSAAGLLGSSVLPGITRDSVFTIARGLRIPVAEQTIRKRGPGGAGSPQPDERDGSQTHESPSCEYPSVRGRFERSGAFVHSAKKTSADLRQRRRCRTALLSARW
jgi:hypothetical protein